MKKLKIILIAILSLSLLFSFTACGGGGGGGTPPKTEHSFSLNKANVEIEVGETFEIVAAYGSEALTYTIDDNSVATVDENGVVTAVKEGVAYVTISAGEVSRTCKVIVVSAEYSITIDCEKAIMVVGTHKKLQAVLERNGEAYTAKVTWDKTGGTLDVDGLVAWFTASEKGEYTVTVTSDKGKTATCVITVVESLADLG